MGLRIQIGFLFLCQLFLPKEIEAQISAIGQSFTDTATYPVSNFKDLVFVYNVSCFGGNNPSVTLLAIAPNNLDSCNYVWTGYNIQDHSFDLAVKTESQVSSSQLSGIGEGGYQVRISRTGKLDTTFRCWIFIHHLSVSVLKTADGKVLTSKYTCQYVELNGSLTTDTLLYYDPVSGDTVKLMNNTSYWWSYSNKEGVKDKAFLNSLNPRTYSPPVYNTHYYLVSTDKFNASCSDTVLYISIQTRSVFEYKYFDHYGDSTGYIPMDPQGVSAPAKFEFINHSINGATYQWILTDTVFAGDTDDNIGLIVKCGDHLMGEEFQLAGQPTFEIRALGTAAITKLDIIRNNRYVFSTVPNRETLDLKWTDSDPSPDPFSYYYVRIQQADGNLAWSSPMWIHPTK